MFERYQNPGAPWGSVVVPDTVCEGSRPDCKDHSYFGLWTTQTCHTLT